MLSHDACMMTKGGLIFGAAFTRRCGAMHAMSIRSAIYTELESCA